MAESGLKKLEELLARWMILTNHLRKPMTTYVSYSPFELVTPVSTSVDSMLVDDVDAVKSDEKNITHLV